MTIDAPANLLIAFLLVTVRASAWIVVAPPFNTRAIPATVKVAIALALAMPVAPQLADHAPAPELGALIPAILWQVATGLALGFLVMLLFAAVQAAGELIDLFTGFSVASLFDPFSNAASTPFGRLYQLLATTLLFALDGHLLLVRGFMESFTVLPLHGSPGQLAKVGIDNVGAFFVSALEIGAPLVAVMVVAELALGLVSRAAPSLNVFSTSFPLKILLALSAGGLAITVLPQAVTSIVDHISHATALTARLMAH